MRGSLPTTMGASWLATMRAASGQVGPPMPISPSSVSTWTNHWVSLIVLSSMAWQPISSGG